MLLPKLLDYRSSAEAVQHGRRAKERMVAANNFVSVAKAQTEQPLIYSGGTIGLVHGVEKFDPTTATNSLLMPIGGFARALPTIAEKSRTIRLPIISPKCSTSSRKGSGS